MKIQQQNKYITKMLKYYRRWYCNANLNSILATFKMFLHALCLIARWVLSYYFSPNHFIHLVSNIFNKFLILNLNAYIRAKKQIWCVWFGTVYKIWFFINLMTIPFGLIEKYFYYYLRHTIRLFFPTLTYNHITLDIWFKFWFLTTKLKWTKKR